MALNAKQKEAIQKVKDTLDEIEIRKARLKAGLIPPAQVKDFDAHKKFDYGAVYGYVEALKFLATEAQAREIAEKVSKYLDKIPK